MRQANELYATPPDARPRVNILSHPRAEQSTRASTSPRFTLPPLAPPSVALASFLARSSLAQSPVAPPVSQARHTTRQRPKRSNSEPGRLARPRSSTATQLAGSSRPWDGADVQPSTFPPVENDTDIDTGTAGTDMSSGDEGTHRASLPAGAFSCSDVLTSCAPQRELQCAVKTSNQDKRGLELADIVDVGTTPPVKAEDLGMIMAKREPNPMLYGMLVLFIVVYAIASIALVLGSRLLLCSL